MTVYDTRLQEMRNTVAVLTADGLEVSLDVTARFATRGPPICRCCTDRSARATGRPWSGRTWSPRCAR